MFRRLLLCLLLLSPLAPLWGQSRPDNPTPFTLRGFIVPIAYPMPEFRTNVLLTINSDIPETAAVQITADSPVIAVDLYRTHDGWIVANRKAWVDVRYIHLSQDPVWLRRAYGSTSVSLNNLLQVEAGDIVVIEPHPLLIQQIVVSVIDNKSNDPFGWSFGVSTIQVKRRNE